MYFQWMSHRFKFVQFFQVGVWYGNEPEYTEFNYNTWIEAHKWYTLFRE